MDAPLLPAVSVSHIWLLFLLGSIAGWCIELAYRSWHTRRFVNPGMLWGPYVPLYGCGLLIVAAHFPLSRHTGVVVSVLSVTLSITLLEYVTGTVIEKLLRIRLWDYSHRRFNLHGRICLRFSVYWLLLVSLVFFLIEVALSTYSGMRGQLQSPQLSSLLQNAAAISAILFLIDSISSTISILRLRRTLQRLRSYVTDAGAAAEEAAEEAAIKIQLRLQHMLVWTRRFPSIARQILYDRSRFGGAADIVPAKYRPSRRYNKRKECINQWVKASFPEAYNGEHQQLIETAVAAVSAFPVRAKPVLHALLYPEDPAGGMNTLRPSERLLVFLVRTRVESMP